METTTNSCPSHRTRYPIAAVLLAAAAHLAVPYRAAGSELTLEKRVLLEIPAGQRIGSLGPVFNRKARRIAYHIEGDGRKLFVIDGKEEPPCDQVGGFQFTPDGTGYKYECRAGGKSSLVRQEGESRTTIPLATVYLSMFGPDGTLAYGVAVDGRVAYQVGGVTSKAYDQLHRLEFSSSGKHFAFSASTGGQEFLVVDGREIGPFQRIEGFQVLDDGTAAYVAQLPAGPGVFRFRDIEEKGDYVRGVMVTADGASWAFTRSTGEGPSTRWQMVHNGRNVGRDYDQIGRLFPISPDGQRVLFVGKREKRWYLVLDGREVGEESYRGVGPYGFTIDGRFIVAADSGKETFLMVGDWKGPRLGGSIRLLTFSPDGARFAYSQAVTITVPVAERVFLGDHTLGDYDQVLDLWFSEDGARLNFVVLEGSRFVEITADLAARP